MRNFVEELKDTPRLLLEADLQPLQGTRFQPTGFPDLGPATYTTSDGVEMLLVESTQSMANRMEEVCWDSGNMTVTEDLQGMPYIKVNLPGDTCTSSILEGHRVDSQYILSDDKIKAEFQKAAPAENQPVQMNVLYKTLFRLDPNSLIHGIFLEDISGRLRFPRALSAFIEAKDVKMVQSGGVFFDHVLAKNNVPYSRTEFHSNSIKAYFNLDVQQIMGYKLSESALNFLILLSFYKITKVLHRGLRLRTACDFESTGILVTRPEGFDLPDFDEIVSAINESISRCNTEGLFNTSAETVITCSSVGKKTERKK